MRNWAQGAISTLFLIAFMFFAAYLGLAAAYLQMPWLFGPAILALCMAALFGVALNRAI